MDMENIKLVLETDYEKYGNSSGMQIDTLSMAVLGNDYNGIEEDNLEYFDSYEAYALDNFDYEAAFLAQLTKAESMAFLGDADELDESYMEQLANYKDDLREKAQMHELDESHALAIAMQEARDNAYDTLRKEWLHGDYREPGLLQQANRKYAVDFNYNEKEDALAFDIEEGELADLIEYQGVENTPEAVGAYIANMIEIGAYEQHRKNTARRIANRESYETRKRISEAQDARKEAERVAKLKAIS